MRRACHCAANGVEHITGDDVRCRSEAIVAYGIGIRREDAAVVIGHAGRSHVVEVRLNHVLVDGPITPNLRRQPKTSVIPQVLSVIDVPTTSAQTPRRPQSQSTS